MICELSATKELWCISAKHGATQNRIYGFSGSLSTPYNDEESPALCIFAVKAIGSEKEVGYVFNNGSDEAHSWRRIGNYIGGGRRKHLVYLDKQSTVKNIILSLYSGQPMETKHGKSKVIVNKPYHIMEDGTEIYDFRIGNLIPSMEHVPLYSNGYLAHDGKDIRAQFNGKSFFTEYDPSLYAGLCASVARWKVNYGTREKEKQNDNPMLVCMVSDFTESVAIAYAEIIYQYHHNVNGLSLIDPRKDGVGFARRVIQNHKDMMDAGLVCDHLTENRANNYSWALAMVPNNFNATFGERAAIAKPYFFYTVWDKKSFCYRIKFGMDDGAYHWEQRYSLVSLDELMKDGKYLYKEMFSEFLKRIGPEFAHTEDETYLRYWSAPKRTYVEDNPLIGIPKELAEAYPRSFSALIEHPR